MKRSAWSRWGEYVPPILVALIILGAIGMFVVAILTRKTVTIPAEYCQWTLTGRTREQPITVYNCYAYDKDGACTMIVPSTTYYTEKEANVACNYTEWK